MRRDFLPIRFNCDLNADYQQILKSLTKTEYSPNLPHTSTQAGLMRHMLESTCFLHDPLLLKRLLLNKYEMKLNEMHKEALEINTIIENAVNKYNSSKLKLAHLETEYYKLKYERSEQKLKELKQSYNDLIEDFKTHISAARDVARAQEQEEFKRDMELSARALKLKPAPLKALHLGLTKTTSALDLIAKDIENDS